jgi:hypothetical protein
MLRAHQSEWPEGCAGYEAADSSKGTQIASVKAVMQENGQHDSGAQADA